MSLCPMLLKIRHSAHSSLHRNGTQVLVTRLDPLKEQPFRGSIDGSTKTQLRVSFMEPFEDLEDGNWRYDVAILHR